jgi:hypothetical protein
LSNSSSKACPAAAAAAAAVACRNTSSNMPRCYSQQQTPWYSAAWQLSTLAVAVYTQAQAASTVIAAVGAAAAAVASSLGFRACLDFLMQIVNQQMYGYPHAACSC